MSEETVPTIDSAISEATWPDLSKDSFKINGQEIKIKMLQVRYVIELGQILHPFLSQIGREMKYIDKWEDPQEYIPILIDVFPHAELVPRIVEIICKNDAKRIKESNGTIPTLEDILAQGDKDGDLTFEDMSEISLALFTKNQKIGKPVMDFFTNAVKRGKQDLQKLKDGSNSLIEMPESPVLEILAENQNP